MILEGIVSTVTAEGVPRFSPMGPDVDRQQTSLVLKPFCSSTTFENLCRERQGIFHVIDDVRLLVSGAINRWTTPPRYHHDAELDGYVLEDACRALAFAVTDVEVDGPRARLDCRISVTKQLRPCFGWNRAQHAVLELAIHATRLHLLEKSFLDDEIQRLQSLVDKTGGQREREAWSTVTGYIREQHSQ